MLVRSPSAFPHFFYGFVRIFFEAGPAQPPPLLEPLVRGMPCSRPTLAVSVTPPTAVVGCPTPSVAFLSSRCRPLLGIDPHLPPPWPSLPHNPGRVVCWLSGAAGIFVKIGECSSKVWGALCSFWNYFLGDVSHFARQNSGEGRECRTGGGWNGQFHVSEYIWEVTVYNVNYVK